MPADRVPGLSGDLVDEPTHPLLGLGGYLDVEHLPTRLAHQVVMVTGEPLGELDEDHPRLVVGAGHHPDFFEYGDRPIQRRQGDLTVEQPVKLRRGDRPGRGMEGVHHPSARSGVPGTGPAEAIGHLWLDAGVEAHDTILAMRTILSQAGRIASVVMVAVLLGACGGQPAAEAGPRVVVSTSILGDLVTRVAGEAFVVEVLMPSGVDPHEYAASASDAARMRDADLVVVIGLGLETGLADALGTLPDGAEVLEVGPALDPLAYPGGTLDPHVWFDPVRMARAVGLIRDGLVGVAPASAPAIDAAAARLVAELAALDEEVADILSVIPPERRLLVVSHDFLRYFADRYRFEVVGSVIPGGSTVAESSAGRIAELADTITERRVAAVFAEGTEPVDLAEALAAESGGIPVVLLMSDALPPGGSYIDLIRTDATLIADVLK